MALVQIEESELATLRTERNEARTKVDQLSGENRELTTKVETAEAAKTAAETAKTEADTKVKNLEDEKAQTDLRDKRMQGLGAGFLAKLGDTTKTVLTELAGKASDDEWDTALKEREEMASKLAGTEIKRDLAADSAAAPTTPPANGGGGAAVPPSFSDGEVAAFMRSGVTQPAGTGGQAPDGATSVRSLARTFAKKPAAAAGENK